MIIENFQDKGRAMNNFTYKTDLGSRAKSRWSYRNMPNFLIKSRLWVQSTQKRLYHYILYINVRSNNEGGRKKLHLDGRKRGFITHYGDVTEEYHSIVGTAEVCGFCLHENLQCSKIEEGIFLSRSQSLFFMGWNCWYYSCSPVLKSG